jgi:hypothetical protein
VVDVEEGDHVHDVQSDHRGTPGQAPDERVSNHSDPAADNQSMTLEVLLVVLWCRIASALHAAGAFNMRDKCIERAGEILAPAGIVRLTRESQSCNKHVARVLIQSAPPWRA